MAKHISPHDRFFRSIMAKPKVIKEFFINYLPERIRSQIDPNKIQLYLTYLVIKEH